jgi:hypothetical protein
MYGRAPKDLGLLYLEPTEMVYCQYLPVRMPGQGRRIPDNLRWIGPVIDRVHAESDEYIYATVRNMYCTAESANRPGWHSDGFGTDDINFIWCDRAPTEFCIQPFSLSNDHDASLLEMAQQAKDENIRTYEPRHLLLLDQYVIHRVAPNAAPGYRTFVKVSVSRSQYNLRGNAHNYLFDYEWEMHERGACRNHPVAEAT